MSFVRRVRIMWIKSRGKDSPKPRQHREQTHMAATDREHVKKDSIAVLLAHSMGGRERVGKERWSLGGRDGTLETSFRVGAEKPVDDYRVIFYSSVKFRRHSPNRYFKLYTQLPNT